MKKEEEKNKKNTNDSVFKEICDIVNYGIAIVDSKNKIKYLNKSFAKDHGYKPKELLEKKLSVFHTKDQMLHVEWLVEELRRKGKFGPVEVLHVRKNGEVFPMLMSAIVFKDMCDWGDCLVAMGVDITERKELEKELKEEMIFIKELFDSSPAYFGAIGKDGKVLRVNRSMLEALGYKEEEMVGKSYLDNFVPEDEHKTLSKIFKTLITSHKPTLNENHILTKDGRRILVEWRGRAVFDEKGKFNYFFGVGGDITEKKKIEEALLEEKNFSEAVINSLPGVFYLIDEKGKFVKWNKNLEKVTGYSSKEISERHPLDYFKGDDKNLVKSKLREVFSKGEAPVEANLITKKGEEIPFYFLGFRMMRGGRPYLVGTAMDISARKKTEEALRENEKKLRTITQNIADAIFAKDKDRKYAFVNPAAAKMMGLPKSKIIGKTADRIFSKEDAEKIKKVDDLNFKGEEVDRVEELKINGKNFSLHTLQSPIKNEKNKVVGIVGVVRDITKQKKIEEELRESEERFRQIAESAGEWIWEVDADGLYTFSSPIVEKMLGYKIEEIVGKKHFYDFFHPKEKEETKKSALSMFPQKKTFRNFINHNVNKKGKDVWFLTSGTPILDKDGKLLGYRGVDTDITKQIESENILKESEEKYRTVFELANDVIILFDKSGNIMDVNNRVEKVAGYKRDELIGRNLLKMSEIFVNEKEVKKVAENFLKRLSGKKVEPYEVDLVKKGNGIVTFEISAVLLREKGEVVGDLAILRDVTERKKVEKMKADFISVASHQLRTPLVGIKWVMERFLKKEQLSKEGEKYIKDVQESTRRLYDLVELLLNVSRIEGGKLVVKPGPLELVGFIEGILQEHESYYKKKKQEIIFSEHPEKFNILTDSVLLRNIVQSIVSNAVEYTPEEGQIEVKLKEKEKTFLIEISDNGIGIPQEDQPTIFDKFTRGKNAVTVKTEGVGLGLYVVKESIDLLKGRVTFESKINEGTTFYVELPLKKHDKK